MCGRAAKRCQPMFWHQATIRLKTPPARLSSGDQRDLSRTAGAAPPAGRAFCSLFLQHTSASLAINENADPDVRADLERWANQAVPEEAPYFEHTAEGPDDMPAHVKAALFGVVADDPGARRPAAARDLAGHLPGRAPRSRPTAASVVATVWGQADEAP